MKVSLALFLWVSAVAVAGPFVQSPYLQLGDHPSDATRMTLLWHATETPAHFSVRVKVLGGKKWEAQPGITHRRIAVRGIEPHLVYAAELTGLKPGIEFDYEVSRDCDVVFMSRALARKSANQAYQFAVFGDCGRITFRRSRLRSR